MTTRAITPPELAKRWGVKPSRVIAWIRAGELRAFDVSSKPGVGQPRYRIGADAIIEFENRRSGAETPKAKIRLRTPTDIIEFIK